MSEPHNICCVIADSLRWDVFAEANPRNILSLGPAKRAYSCGNSTLPSLMSILMNYPLIGIGKGFFVQEVEEVELKKGDAIIRKMKRWKEIRKWMPRYFKEKGYVTMWLSSNAVPLRLDSELEGAISRHFDYWRSTEYLELDLKPPYTATPQIVQDLDALVKEHKDQPIFSVILLVDTHSPYYDGKRTWLIDPGQPDLNRHRQLMAMKYTDSIFPNFIRIFQQTNRPTEFIFTADHGENLGGPGWGHSSFRSALTMGLELFCVPFIKRRIDDWSKIKITVMQGTAHKDYWDQRYASGGGSGIGSIEQRDWKWSQIMRYVKEPLSVIDVGCGDLIFWDSPFAPSIKSYVGIDKSKVIIEKNLARINSDRMKFIHSPAEQFQEGITAPTVLCVDLLFHIMENEAYIQILQNLCRYSTQHIFIHTWRENPFKDSDTDGVYQKYRNFEAESYQKIFNEAGFQMVDEVSNPNRIGTMYIYQKVS